MRIEPVTGRRDGRTRAALLALCAFAVMAVLPLVLLALTAEGRLPGAFALRTSVDAAEDAEAVPVWRTVAARHGGFDVDAPRWRPLGQETAVLRRSDGLSREAFRFGDAGDGRRSATLVVDRGPLSAGGPAADIASLAAELDLPAEIAGSPAPLLTKFGPMISADMTVRGREGDKTCLGFALRAAEAELRIAGWVCSAGPEMVSRLEAACLVDRLFAVGLRDAPVAGFFARAELARQPCSPQPSTASALSEPGGRASPLRLNRL